MRKMILIIGVYDYRMNSFLKHNLINQPYKVINKSCNVNLIHDEVTIIIPFAYVGSGDVITNTEIHLPELLMSLKINKLIYYNPYNEERLKNLCSHFNVVCERASFV